MSASEVLQSPQKLSSQQLRKIKKPIIEKRRRERINESLNQLKTLVLEALNKDESQYNKMEKADILEMTVKHLKGLQSRLSKGLVASQPHVVNRYKTGYKECADEVTRYLNSVHNVHPQVKDHLNQHLSVCSQKFEHYSNGNNNNSELDKTDANLKQIDGNTTSAALPGKVMNGIQVGLPVMNVSQSMMLAATGPVSPVHSTQGFVPVIISPNNSVSVVSPVQQQQHQHQTQQAHHQIQTSPLPGSVIPLYSHCSPSSCRSPSDSSLQSSESPSPVYTKESNLNVYQSLHFQTVSNCSTPKLSSYNSPSSPIMAEDVPKSNFPHYPEETFVPAQNLEFVDKNKNLKTRDFYNTKNIVSDRKVIDCPNEQQSSQNSYVMSTKLHSTTWGEYAKNLHKYGREILVHSPNGSPVWRPW